MRLLAAGLLTAYLLGIGAGPTLAQSSPYEPEAPSWRVEVPEAGLALSLPRHWEVSVRMDEPSLGEHLEDPDRSWWLVLDAKSPYEFKEPRHGGCDVWLFRTEYPDTDAATLDDIWSDPYTYWNSPMYEATHTETEVMLPAGPATRFDFGDPPIDYGASATVGIEDEGQDPTYFLEYSCNTADLSDGLAILYTTGPVPVDLMSLSVE